MSYVTIVVCDLMLAVFVVVLCYGAFEVFLAFPNHGNSKTNERGRHMSVV